MSLGGFFRSLFGGGSAAPAPASSPSPAPAKPAAASASPAAALKKALATVGNPHFFSAVQLGGPSGVASGHALHVSANSTGPVDAVFAIDKAGFSAASARAQLHYGAILVVIGKEASGKADGFRTMGSGSEGGVAWAVYRRI